MSDERYVLINGKYHLRDKLKADLFKYHHELNCYREVLLSDDLNGEQKERINGMVLRLESFIEIIETLS